MLQRIPHTPAPTSLKATHTPSLIRILSALPNFPYSTPILGALIAPLAWQNLHDVKHGPYFGTPRTAPGNLTWSRGRWARWAELASITDAAPAAPYSKRYVSLLGAFPGRKLAPSPKFSHEDWAIGVLDADGLLSDAAEEHGLRVWTSLEWKLATDERLRSGGGKGEGERKELWNDLGRMVAWDGVPGSERGDAVQPGWEDEAELRELREGKGRVQRWIYAMMRDIAVRDRIAGSADDTGAEETPRNRSLTDLPAHLHPYIKYLETFSSRRNAEFKLYWNPVIKGMRNSVRLYLPESAEWLEGQDTEDGSCMVEGMEMDEMERVSQALGGRYSVVYLSKGLPWSSVYHDPTTGEPAAWVTVRNDLSIMTPHLAMPRAQFKQPVEEIVKALIKQTARLIYKSLRYTVFKPEGAYTSARAESPSDTSTPTSPEGADHPDFHPQPSRYLHPSASLLSHLPPHALPLTATVTPTHPSLSLFRSLGFLPLQGQGFVDLALGWNKARMRDPQLWERALTPDGRENPPNPWAVGFDPDEPRYPPMSNSPFLAPTHTAPAAGAARRELTQQQSHRLDVGGAKGKEVEGFLQRQPRVLDTDLAAGWQARTRQSEGSGAEGVLLPDMSEEDDRTYDDGKRRFTFPVHQFVFYDPKMKAKMFPDRRPHPKGFKKR